MTLEIGDTVDRYVVEGLLGRGGMALVFKVRHVTLGTEHALKVLTTNNGNLQGRLVREGRAQASLAHPHVLTVSDVLAVKGSIGLLMAYVDGPDLDDLLYEYGPSPDEALDIFRAICTGVGVAHAEGLIHRDLKPGNVLLSVERGGSVLPKVADFGLVKAAGEEGKFYKQTRTGMTMGTPAYMSPEQIADTSTVDRRTDIWALGCMLYELVTHKTVFEAPNLRELFNLVAEGRYAPPETHLPTIPPLIAAVIEACLQVDPVDRIADCGAILAFLDGTTDALPPAGVPLGELGPPVPMPDTIIRLGSDRRISSTAVSLRKRESASKSIETMHLQTQDTVLPGTGADISTEELAVAPETLPPQGRSSVAVLAMVGVGVGLGLLLLVGGGVGAVLYTGARDGSVEPPRPVQPGPEPVEAPDPVPSPEPTVLPEPTEVPAPVAPAPAVVPEPTIVPRPPDPEPAPEPVAPAPTEPEPVEPEPDPEPAPPPTSVLTFSGVSQLWLEPVGGGSAVRNGKPTEGVYRIFAVFPGSDTGSEAGRVTVSPPAPVHIACTSQMLRCAPR